MAGGELIDASFEISGFEGGILARGRSRSGRRPAAG